MQSVNRARQDSLPANIRMNSQMMRRGVLGETQFQKDQQQKGQSGRVVKKPRASNVSMPKKNRKRGKKNAKQADNSDV